VRRTRSLAVSQEGGAAGACRSSAPRRPHHRRLKAASARTGAWQEWQGWAFVRVRSRSLARTKSLQTRRLRARARTGANIAGICHAEGRGFEAYHPLKDLENTHFCLRSGLHNLLHAGQVDSGCVRASRRLSQRLIITGFRSCRIEGTRFVSDFLPSVGSRLPVESRICPEACANAPRLHRAIAISARWGRELWTRRALSGAELRDSHRDVGNAACRPRRRARAEQPLLGQL
jgi:hypothetical protein